MRALVGVFLVGCAPGWVQGFESGQVGQPIAGPIVGQSMQDLWAPLIGSGYTPTGFGHYDGVGWRDSGRVAAAGYAATSDGVWLADYASLAFVATDGTITDRTADLPQPFVGGELHLAGNLEGNVIVGSVVDNGTDRDDLVFSSLEGGVITPLVTLPSGAGTIAYPGVLAVNGPGDAYLTGATGLQRLRDGALTPVTLPGWDLTQSPPRILSAGPDDAWTSSVSVDAEGTLLQRLFHDDGAGFVEVPFEWSYEDQGGLGPLHALPGGEVIVTGSRITATSWVGPDDGSGYGYQLNEMELLVAHVFADGRVTPDRLMFQCTSDPGQPPCSVGTYGVLADGTLVLVNGLMWWHGSIEAL